MNVKINDVKIHDLPASAQNLVRLIGLIKTLKLVDNLGGTTFPVPVGSNRLGQMRYERLAEVIGEDAATALCAEYARENLYIPNCKEAIRKVRDRIIHSRFDALVKNGHSSNAAVDMLARENTLCDRRIWKILKVLPDQPIAQNSLF